MDVINGKLEDNDLVVNSMGKMSKIFSRYFQNKNSRKYVIRTDVKKSENDVDGNDKYT